MIGSHDAPLSVPNTISPAFADKSEGGGVPRSPLKTPPKTMIVSFFGGFVCKKYFGTRGLKQKKNIKKSKIHATGPGGIDRTRREDFLFT